MTDYMILFPADREDEWDAKTDEERKAVYETDYEFGRLLEQRGGRMTGGAELSTWRRARAIRRGPNGTTLVTDGPYAESAEQLSGFYLVLDGSDNFPTRYLVNDAAVLAGLPVVWGAVHQTGGQAGVSWAAHGPHYRDLFPVPPEPVPFDCAKAEPATKRAAAAVNANVLIFIVNSFHSR